MDAPEKVKSTHITGVRVRFIPEATRNNVNKVTTRALISNNIFWEEWGVKGSSEEGDGEPENPFE